MADPPEDAGSDAGTIVVSLRLKPEIAEAFRAEAARRNTRLVRVFEEMWQHYKSLPPPSPNKPRKPRKSR